MLFSMEMIYMLFISSIYMNWVSPKNDKIIMINYYDIVGYCAYNGSKEGIVNLCIVSAFILNKV